MKLVTTEFKSGGLHEKHVVATWNLGKALWVLVIICMRQLQAVLIIDSFLPFFSDLTFIRSN